MIYLLFFLRTGGMIHYLCPKVNMPVSSGQISLHAAARFLRTAFSFRLSFLFPCSLYLLCFTPQNAQSGVLQRFRGSGAVPAISYLRRLPLIISPKFTYNFICPFSVSDASDEFRKTIGATVTNPIQLSLKIIDPSPIHRDGLSE